ncbi:MAG: hypothetical protein IBJ18_03535 [Phycisphaerales bacterium]|nr:hypothetical protein [Phycisphaerales bacterium]
MASRDFFRDLGGLTSADVTLGLRVHAFVVALSVALVALVLLSPVFIFAAFVLWIGFTVGTCYLADLNAAPRAGRRSLMFFAIVGSTVLTVFSPFLAIALEATPPMGLIFLLMTLGNAVQFYLINERHTAISKTFTKFSLTRTPAVFRFFTIFVHGLVGLPLALWVSLGLLFSEHGFFIAGIAILYSLPLHGVWLLWLGIRSAHYARKLRLWSIGRQPRLPA